MVRKVSTPLARLLLPLIALFVTTHVNATIFVPEEIPSLLSVVYSNIPPIKKGTDSRLGVGFRLGPNADVQFQLELGPQTNTQPIGAAAAGTSGGGGGGTAAASKRHATVAPAGGGKPKDWLNAWRLQMSPGYVPADDGGRRAETGHADDHGGPADAVAHLRQLYKPQPAVARERRSEDSAGNGPNGKTAYASDRGAHVS